MKNNIIDLNNYHDARSYNYSCPKSRESLKKQLQAYKSSYHFEIKELNGWGIRGMLVIFVNETKHANFVFISCTDEEYGDLVSFIYDNSKSPFS